MNFYKKNKKGFTLIDILLTAAIISLLSSVFLFRVSEAKKKAEDAHMKVETQQVSNAIALYKNDNNGKVPLTVTSGSNSDYTNKMHYENDPNSAYLSTMETLVSLGYLSEVPTSPNGESYAYGVTDDFENAIFFTELSSSDNTENNTQNECPFTIEEEESPGLMTGCFQIHYLNASTYNFSSCSQYVDDNPGKVCVPGSSAEFCDIYNTTGDYADVCACTGMGCGTYGGNYANVPSNGIFEPAFVCSLPEEEEQLCTGSNNRDYCQCI